jgi:hypothetical protein
MAHTTLLHHCRIYIQLILVPDGPLAVYYVRDLHSHNLSHLAYYVPPGGTTEFGVAACMRLAIAESVVTFVSRALGAHPRCVGILSESEVRHCISYCYS